MISNQVIQNTLTEIADITNVNAAVCDASGKLIGSRGETAPIDDKLIGSFAHSQSPEQETADLLLGRISDDGEIAFVAVVDKGAPNAAMALKLIVTQTENLVQAYKEKLDKDSFIKNLLLDNLLQIDIFNRAKKLHIEFKQPRAVFIVETKGQETPVNEILHQTFAGQAGEFVTGIDEDIQVVVHEVRGTAPHDEELKDMADQIYGVLKGAGISCRVSYGAVVDELKDVSIGAHQSISFPSIYTALIRVSETIGSPSHITMSASFPTSREPTLSAIPICSAGFIVIALSASKGSIPA